MKKHKKELFTLTIVLLFFLITANLLNLSIFFILSAILAFFGFYIYKSIALIYSFKERKMNILDTLKLFFICDFVELITLSGKIGSDATKLFFLKEKYSLKEITKSIIIFRTSTVISLILIITLLLLITFNLINFSFIILFILILLFFFKKTFFVPIFTNLISDIFRIFLFISLLIEFNIELNLTLILIFIGANTLARAFIFIPHGLLIQDFIIATALLQNTTLPNNILFNSILRSITIIPSAILGGIIISKKGLERIKQVIKKGQKIKFPKIERYLNNK